MNENINVLTIKIKKAEDELNQLLNEEMEKNLDKIQLISDFSENNTKDINLKIDDLSHQILSLLKYIKNNNKSNDNNILNKEKSPNMILIKEIIYNTFDEILQPVKQNFNDYNLELRNDLTDKTENSKKLYSLEQIDSMKKI